MQLSLKFLRLKIHVLKHCLGSRFDAVWLYLGLFITNCNADLGKLVKFLELTCPKQDLRQRVEFSVVAGKLLSMSRTMDRAYVMVLIPLLVPTCPKIITTSNF